MSYRTGKNFAARMDDLAGLTGVLRLGDRLAQDRQRRRHLRWPSIIALALATFGFGLTLVMPGRPLPGATMLWVGEGLALFLTWFGPVKPWSAVHVDERDRQLRRDAYFAALTAATGVAIFGLIGIAGLVLLAGWDRWTLVIEMAMLAFYLTLLCSIVPTLYVSWTTRPIEDE
jgi:hypothetical protein